MEEDEIPVPESPTSQERSARVRRDSFEDDGLLPALTR